MSKVYHIGDLHLGHRNIMKYRKGFNQGTTSEQHDEIVVDILCSSLSRRDTLFLHGDIFFTEHVVDKYSETILNSCQNVHLVMGNHDLERVSVQDKIRCMSKLISCGYNIHGIAKRNMFWLTHAPVHCDELRGKFNIHGHVHNMTIDDYRYVNVSWDNCYMGKPIDQLLIKSAVDSKMVIIGGDLNEQTFQN